MWRLAVPVVLALLGAPSVAHADAAADPAQDAEVARILNAKGMTQRWTAVGKRGHYGHAETLVDASASRVRDEALKFSTYKDIHRKFASARVVGKEKDRTDVYLKLPVKVGPFSVDQWEVIRFAPARTEGRMHIVEGSAVQGNMKDGHIVISVRPVDEKHALLKIDFLLVPSMPAPQSMVDEEVRDAAFDFANGLKDKAQGWVGPVTSL